MQQATDRTTPNRLRIRRAAVLGAGTMGAQIAAHLANLGFPVDLLDLPTPAESGDRNRVAVRGLERVRKLQPAPLYSPRSLELIRPGNFEDDLDRLARADWVIEAVVERLDVKRSLWARAQEHVAARAVLSSNTSGIPIADIARELPAGLRRRFLGTHFFNPPRYLKLLEVVPTENTDPALVESFRRFGEDLLGKGVVVAHDRPNFIANRIGTYGLAITLEAMSRYGFGPDEVDAITGPAMGRPKSATFRTLDVVGIDVFVDVCDNIRSHLESEWEKAAFTLPHYVYELVKQGRIGEKAKVGFFKRIKQEDKKEILALDPATLEYRPRRKPQSATLQQARQAEDPGERLRILVNGKDDAARFAWEVLSLGMLYSAQVAGEVAGDIRSIDQALRWGFGWELGPFETWDTLGLDAVASRMEADGHRLPNWVNKWRSGEATAFYKDAEGGVRLPSPHGGMTVLPYPRREVSVPRLGRERRAVRRRPGATLWDAGDEVAFLDFHSPKQAIGPDMMEMLHWAAEEIPGSFRGMMVGSHVSPNFCVGANVMLMLVAAQDEDWDEIDLFIRQFQDANQKLRYMDCPVVAAPYGLTLGGGAEISMACDRTVASPETYIGLVETGIGLIPAGGGCKEMLFRLMRTVPGLLGGDSRAAAAAAGDIAANPFVARLFETLATARVARSPVEARRLGFFRPVDTVVPNELHLLYHAKQVVLEMDRLGYRPPQPEPVPVIGRDGKALLEFAAQSLVWAGQASEHDLAVAKRLAHVLAGGDVPAGKPVSEQTFLDLEREAFLRLVGHPKTQARMQHTLKTGKPLRN